MPAPGRAKSQQQSPHHVLVKWCAPIVLIALAFLAYRNSFDGPFIFDDKPAITENPYIRNLWPLQESVKAPPQTAVTGRPVVSLSLALNYVISGLDVGSYHWFNLIAHMAMGLAMYGVTRRTLLHAAGASMSGAHATVLAAVVSAVWLVHPLASDTVLYVSNRTELLMGLFAVLTMYCAIRSLHGGHAWLWNVAAVVCCALGMLSKEAMAGVPLLVMLYDWVFSRRSFKELIRTRWPLYAGLLATWIPLLMVVFSGARTLSVGFNLGVQWWEYLFTQTHALVIYLRLSVFPDSLSILYDTPVIRTIREAVAPGALIVALLVLTFVCVWKRWWPGFVGAWFFLILAPSSSVVPLVTELVTERRMYAPLAAIVAMIVIGSDRLLALLEARAGVPRALRLSLSLLLATTVVAVMVWATERRSDDFDSEKLIFQDAVQKAPNSYAAHNNLGLALMAEGDISSAIEHYRRTVELNPKSAEGFDNLGVAFAISGRYRQAQQAFTQALDLAFDFQRPVVLNDFAYLLATCPEPGVRDPIQAMTLAEQAVALGGENLSVLDTLAVAYASARRFEDAAASLRRARDLFAAGLDDLKQQELSARIAEYERLARLPREAGPH